MLHIKNAAAVFSENNPVHSAETIPGVIKALTSQASRRSEGKEGSASMKVLLNHLLRCGFNIYFLNKSLCDPVRANLEPEGIRQKRVTN